MKKQDLHMQLVIPTSAAHIILDSTEYPVITLSWVSFQASQELDWSHVAGGIHDDAHRAGGADVAGAYRSTQ